MVLLMEEIRRSSVDMGGEGSSSHYLQGFMDPRWLGNGISSMNEQ